MKAIVAILALGALLAPQASAPPAKERLEPGLIRGRVTAADTGRPLRRATVSLTPNAARTGRPVQSVSTNSQGVFELRDVVPGAYLVSATRAGYLQIQHGQRTPREPGVAVDVRSGATLERIDVALPRGSVIAGRVFDELGAPYPGVRVTALELQYQVGERVFFPVGIGTTDDLGQYRISGLQPGRYRVVAESSETWRTEKGETLGYAATFYPSTPSPDASPLITLNVAQRRLDLDFSLAASRTARLRGRVQRPDGTPLPSETVSLGRSPFPGLQMPGRVSTRSATDGSFELRDVPPGSYGLRAGSRNSIGNVWLTVTGADLDNLLLVSRSGGTVRGVVVTDSGETPPFTPSGVRPSLLAARRTGHSYGPPPGGEQRLDLHAEQRQRPVCLSHRQPPQRLDAAPDCRWRT